jgi:holin-like protein
MYFALALIIALQVLGTMIVGVLDVPVPGPVLGMMLFLIGLWLYGRVPSELDKVTRFFLANLSLLFVPAAVGIIRHLDLVTPYMAQLLFTLFISLITGFIVTACAFAFLARKLSPASDEELQK